MSVKNPHKVEEVDDRTPQEIADEFVALNDTGQKILNEILEML